MSARKSNSPGKKPPSRSIPSVVEELAQIIEKGLKRFPAEERSARLDRIHLILSGAAKPHLGTSAKRQRIPANLRSSQRRAKQS